MDISLFLKKIFQEEQLLYAVLSLPDKVTIRPLLVKNEPHFQLSERRGAQIFHKNLNGAACQSYLKENLSFPCKQALLCTDRHDYHLLFNKKGTVKILVKPPTRIEREPPSHNRAKNYILQENNPLPFLVALGVMNEQGKVYREKRDKFKQINHFLELVSQTLSELNQQEGKPLQVIDFGCGKAYLTFALHYYLKEVLRRDVEILGLDLKSDVVAFCQGVAEKLACEGLKFAVGEIASHHYCGGQLDLVIALHACNTATDAALDKAIRWGARVILAVPCCHHELYHQIKSPLLAPLLKHPILKERFAALATDAARASLLEIAGYKTDVIEFIDLEHTPKNLLIRAVKREEAFFTRTVTDEYDRFKALLQIHPSLERGVL